MELRYTLGASSLWIVGVSGLVVRVSDSDTHMRFASHCRLFASNLEQVANLLCAQVNSASYSSRDWNE